MLYYRYENERTIDYCRNDGADLFDFLWYHSVAYSMKVGDLVSVGAKGKEKRFPSIILEICLPRNHRNGMHLIKVLENGHSKWYPAAYIEVINEGR